MNRFCFYITIHSICLNAAYTMKVASKGSIFSKQLQTVDKTDRWPGKGFFCISRPQHHRCGNSKGAISEPIAWTFKIQSLISPKASSRKLKTDANCGPLDRLLLFMAIRCSINTFALLDQLPHLGKDEKERTRSTGPKTIMQKQKKKQRTLRTQSKEIRFKTLLQSGR